MFKYKLKAMTKMNVVAFCACVYIYWALFSHFLPHLTMIGCGIFDLC